MALHVYFKASGTAPEQATGQYVQQGRTARFEVSYDASLGAQGSALADAMLQTCEIDYAATAAYFGDLTPPGLPVTVFIDPGSDGAYHMSCADTALHCDAFAGTDADLVRMLMVAELVEVFEAAQNQGWDCGASNGEGLSRVLATEQYPAQLDGFATAAAWLDSSDRPDFVNATDPTDRNAVSTGCAVLFLNYLRYQLGYSWPAIAQAAGATLRQSSNALTATNDDPFPPFAALLQGAYPAGMPSGLTTDNPFPIGG